VALQRDGVIVPAFMADVLGTVKKGYPVFEQQHPLLHEKPFDRTGRKR
jgi:hypothetical protein